MNNYLGLHNRLQYFLVSLNEAAIYLDNLTLRLESIREFANFFRLFHTVILYFRPVFLDNMLSFEEYRIIFFLC
jgi:hypothetical protein